MDKPKPKYDIVLVGGGIMSATLGTFLREFDPNLKIALFERLDHVAEESSSAWNNAGTGHCGFCELNYTPKTKDGSIDITKPQRIVEQFEISKQFWSYLIEQGYINSPKEFINSCPHMSLISGGEDVAFLKKRYEAMSQSHLFKGMQYTEDFETLKEWVPLIMRQRSANERLAATKMDLGTDVNFGAITRKLTKHLQENTDVEVFCNHEVKEISNYGDTWRLKIKDVAHQHQVEVEAGFVFVGAGGYALPLLQSSGIKEIEGFGGFPVSGEWLVTKDPELVAQHSTKVYTQASVGAPPMSVPHLDLRIINGEKALLFGPFAGFSTKFLKKGSYWDLIKSIRWKNIRTMLQAGWSNLSLTKYLIQQVTMSKSERIAHLRTFVKDADPEKWDLQIAGQRVQIIKKDKNGKGILQFGTEVVTNDKRTISGLLGASPGASTAVYAMLTVLEKCFGDKLQNEWQAKLKEIIPSYGTALKDNPELTEKIRAYTKEKLELNY